MSEKKRYSWLLNVISIEKPNWIYVRCDSPHENKEIFPLPQRVIKNSECKFKWHIAYILWIGPISIDVNISHSVIYFINSELIVICSCGSDIPSRKSPGRFAVTPSLAISINIRPQYGPTDFDLLWIKNYAPINALIAFYCLLFVAVL